MARGVCIEYFRESVRRWIIEAIETHLCRDGDGGEYDHRDHGQKHRNHGHDHFIRAEFLAHKFRRSSDHETRDEHGEDHVKKYPYETDPDSAENDLADSYVEHLYQTSEGHVAVVHAVDGPV